MENADEGTRQELSESNAARSGKDKSKVRISLVFVLCASGGDLVFPTYDLQYDETGVLNR